MQGVSSTGKEKIFRSKKRAQEGGVPITAWGCTRGSLNRGRGGHGKRVCEGGILVLVLILSSGLECEHDMSEWLTVKSFYFRGLYSVKETEWSGIG